MTSEDRDPQTAAGGQGATDKPVVPGTAEEAGGVLGNIQELQITADKERPALDDAIDAARRIDEQRAAEAAANTPEAAAAAAAIAEVEGGVEAEPVEAAGADDAAAPVLTAADTEVAPVTAPATELGFMDEAEADIDHVGEGEEEWAKGSSPVDAAIDAATRVDHERAAEGGDEDAAAGPEGGFVTEAVEDVVLDSQGDAEWGKDSSPVDAAVAAAGAATATAKGRGRKGQPARTQAAAPSVSEQAVRVDDRASAVFVLGIVGLFLAIVLAALLIGPGSLLGNVLRSAPTPVPTVQVTPAPSVDASPSAEASPAAASPSPSAS